jgi:ubiquinone/menaquinone biosynthesis C-methylase UbiE
MKDVDIVKLTVNSYSEHAEEYSRFHFKESFENRLELFIKFLPYKKLVLDAGCGCGRDTKYLIEHGINTIGIDLSYGIIEQARIHVPKAKFIQMDMRKLEFEESSFSGIFAMASVFHIPKEQMPDLLIEFRRVLKNDGLLYICVMKGSSEKMVEKSAAVDKMGPRFFAFYDKEELSNLLDQAGFKTIYTFIDKYLKVDWLNIYARKI